jgi:hypothetical protein
VFREPAGASRPAFGVHQIALALVLLGYTAVRVRAWQLSTRLEDHDSTSYLTNAELIRALDVDRLASVNPDHTPFYPFFTALFSLPGWSTEFGARLCSLAFSLALFGALVAIGRRYLEPYAIITGLLLLAFTPVLVLLSVSVLSEPSYIGTVYIGLWLFVVQYRSPNAWTGALLGTAFGLTFLNRIEGLIYLGLIPLLQAAHYLFTRQTKYSLHRLGKWVLAYGLAYVVIVAPQIWRVSSHMGEFSINGRQVWSALLTPNDGRAIQERLRGLDYSAGQTNLEYLQRDPEARRQLRASVSPMSHIKLAARNFDKLQREQLGNLVGPGVLVFFAFGLVGLYRSGSRFFVLVALTFIGASLLAPLLQTNLLLRHLAVIVPIMALIAGDGILRVAHSITPPGSRQARQIVAPALAGLVVAGWLMPLRDGMAAPTNNEYAPETLAEPVRLVRLSQEEILGRPARVARAKAYLTYYAGADGLRLPYTDYSGLVRYLILNRVDFLFLEYAHIAEFPFVTEFQRGDPPPGFALLHRGIGPVGRVELFRFIPEQASVSVEAGPAAEARER